MDEIGHSIYNRKEEVLEILKQEVEQTLNRSKNRKPVEPDQ